MARRVNMHLDEEFAARIEEKKPKSLALAAFCALLIEQQLEGLTGVGKVPAYCVGAGNDTDTQASASPKLPASTTPTNPLPESGEGVGRESEGTPRRGRSLSSKRKKPAKNSEVPFVITDETDLKPPSAVHDYSDLLPAFEEIKVFWQAKSGSVSAFAWEGLLRECNKIRRHPKGGMEAVKAQLELAAANGYSGIDASRWIAYAVNRGRPAFQPQNTEPRHPASQVYTAKDFDGPTTNPVLEGLF